MNLLVKKPQQVIWALIPILFLLSYLVDANVEVNRPSLHFPLTMLWPYAAIILFLVGLGYFLLQEYGGKLLDWATNAHIGLLIVSLLWYFMLKIDSSLHPDIPIKEYIFISKVIFCTFGLSVLFYLINIVVSISRKVFQ